MKSFDNKVAVITGAASGIGLSLAKKAASLGMRLVIVDINEEQLSGVKTELEELGTKAVMAAVCDVSDAAQMDKLASKTIEAFGTVHLLFNNAGVGAGGNLWELDADYWDWVLGINLHGIIHGIRNFTPYMIKQNEGHIINTASIAGLMSAPGTGPYTVSKHAVVAMSELLYGDLRKAEADVGVSVLCPSFVNTKIYTSERNRPVDEATRNDPARQTELDAVEEVASAFFGSAALSTEVVADEVFAAIESGKFYILTHPEGSRQQIEKRMRAILDDGYPPASGVEDFPLA
jgi:NAD(P)-dependent dehydrogenase (short-subunit alcohol dehydrogenase family)